MKPHPVLMPSGLLLVAGMQLACGLVYLPPDPMTLDRRPGFTFQTRSFPGSLLRLCVEEGVETTGLEPDLRQRLRQAQAWLGLPETPETCYVMASPQRVRDLLGIRWRSQVDGKAYPEAGVVVGTRESLMTQAHEHTHVLAQRAWGATEAWISEGVAVASDGQWHGVPLHDLVDQHRREGRLLPLGTLARTFGSQDVHLSYPQAGSFMAFLKDTQGLSAVKALWCGGPSALRQLTGKSMEDLESAWQAQLAAPHPTPSLPPRPDPAAPSSLNPLSAPSRVGATL